MIVALATVVAAAYTVVAVWRRSWLMLIALFLAVEAPLLALGTTYGLTWIWDIELAQVGVAVCAVIVLGLVAIGLRNRQTAAALVALGLLAIPNALLYAFFFYCDVSDDPAGCYWVPVVASLAVVPISLLTGGGVALWSAVAPLDDES